MGKNDQLGLCYFSKNLTSYMDRCCRQDPVNFFFFFFCVILYFFFKLMAYPTFAAARLEWGFGIMLKADLYRRSSLLLLARCNVNNNNNKMMISTRFVVLRGNTFSSLKIPLHLFLIFFYILFLLKNENSNKLNVVWKSWNQSERN